ncbi:hypothetical protein [Paraburkholderia antibiotica]|uniref:Uncharacterized protein n=1 Tax=Paraburkholderia antibiotica TaxID=2728839 RepID=A0A7X9X1W5_9BURK|nr:hypothetical protein [Paraburkholderia antibiotica]NML29906.1 hypothetical protein [Paraburkholderia antibiotica]
MKARNLLTVSLLALSALPALSAHAQMVRSIGIARNPAVAAADRAQGSWRNRNVTSGVAASPSGASSTQANAGGNGNRGGAGVGFVPLPTTR